MVTFVIDAGNDDAAPLETMARINKSPVLPTLGKESVVAAVGPVTVGAARVPVVPLIAITAKVGVPSASLYEKLSALEAVAVRVYILNRAPTAAGYCSTLVTNVQLAPPTEKLGASFELFVLSLDSKKATNVSPLVKPEIEEKVKTPVFPAAVPRTARDAAAAAFVDPIRPTIEGRITYYQTRTM
jgi:hypothetical protein